jgi:hypothetical protein
MPAHRVNQSLNSLLLCFRVAVFSGAVQLSFSAITLIREFLIASVPVTLTQRHLGLATSPILLPNEFLVCWPLSMLKEN